MFYRSDYLVKSMLTALLPVIAVSLCFKRVESAVVIKERKWWVALLLQFYFGSGYIYLGRPVRLAAYVVFLIFSAVAGLLPPPDLVEVRIYTFGISAAMMLVSVFVLVDAIRLAFLQKDYKLRPYNRWWVYLLYWTAMSVAYGAAMFMAAPNLKIPYYAAPYTENAPGLIPGDTIFAEICDGPCSDLRRGDMIVFNIPELGRRTYIRRIIGLPGDLIQIQNGIVVLNGTPLKTQRLPDDFKFTDFFNEQLVRSQYEEAFPNGRKHLILRQNLKGTIVHTNPYRVPEGRYFVMGDNRDNLTDRELIRNVGSISAEHIFAKASFIYWSDDLSRIGTLINP
ncbi:Signal peptidase I [Pseudovibrio sp. WM33]|nr:Signal peptidase I [Pseudovibrio sp. WM33]